MQAWNGLQVGEVRVSHSGSADNFFIYIQLPNCDIPYKHRIPHKTVVLYCVCAMRCLVSWPRPFPPQRLEITCFIQKHSILELGCQYGLKEIRDWGAQPNLCRSQKILKQVGNALELTTGQGEYFPLLGVSPNKPTGASAPAQIRVPCQCLDQGYTTWGQDWDLP